MKKLWVKCFLISSSIVMLIVSLICGITLVNSNISRAEEKYIFDSIYEDTDFDFIIPSPANEQVCELDHNEDKGIEEIIPYYMVDTDVTVNGNTLMSELFMFPDASKMEFTPYNSKRIIAGQIPKELDACVDYEFAVRSNCHVGDTIIINIGDKTFETQIESITLTNIYEKDGTVAIVLDSNMSELLASEGASYSAAYVKANNLKKCEQYLYSEYLPYGRLKNTEDFSSEETYNQHVQNFNNADWSKEITNCQSNYQSLSIKYANVENSILLNQFINAVIVLSSVIVIMTVLLRTSSVNSFMKAYLIKRGGLVDQISKFYSSGASWTFIIYLLASIGIYYWIISKSVLRPIGNVTLNYLVPLVSAGIATIIMVIVCKNYVNRVYVVIKKKYDEEEKQRTEAEKQKAEAVQAQKTMEEDMEFERSHEVENLPVSDSTITIENENVHKEL